MENRNTSILLWMTNRGRAWVYERIARELAVDLGLAVTFAYFLDTSAVDSREEGAKRLLDILGSLRLTTGATLILIKDAKWQPGCPAIAGTFAHNRVLCADVPIETVDSYAQSGDVEGFVNEVKSRILPA